jgi:hypothetical protein
MSQLLDVQIAKIDREYIKIKELGCAYGWRFLYTPANTLMRPNGLMFLGLNPGGCGSSVVRTVEEGNAYRVEYWKNEPKKLPNSLQNQVRAFFQLLAQSQLGERASHDCKRLMDETLTSNFCPFRSPSWTEFRPKKARVAAIDFSIMLWAEIIPEVRPRVIFCMGATQYPYLNCLLENISSECGTEEHLPTGWGDIQFAVRQYKCAGWTTILARMPHLSQYKLLNSPKYADKVDAFIGKLANVAD